MASQLSILNPFPQKLPGPSLLHHLVQQANSGNTPALDYLDDRGERHRTSYETLHVKSSTLASHLRQLRINSSQPDDRRFIVPVFIGQCPELYMTQLAILKAGGAFCPLTLDVPEERLRFILQDASATVLVTTSELKDRLPQLENVSVVVADESMQGSECEAPAVEIDSKSTAYVMYTSGSTGQPKGVLLSHSSATQALLAHDRHIPEFSRFLQFASPTFDVSVFEIFFPLFRGCTLVVCERKRMLNDLPATINDLDVDAAELTPSVANSLLSGRASVPGLKVLLTIGEMLKQAVVEDFGGSADEPAVLHGMYGPTEATIHCTLQPNFGKDMPVNNIGIPLDTVSAFVVRPASDEHPSHLVEILPAGEEGELAVGGYQLADGYLNREEQTKAAFVSHPEFGQLYRTGDRARLDSHQRLMCLGRISSGQVKLRGQRIELGEIEYAASRTPGCRDVSVDVISDTMVAFCVSSSPDITENQIQDTCKKWLPPYMVPTDILILETMPYLPSGKIDRRTLQGLHKTYRESEDVPASMIVDDKIRQLADVFNEVMKLDILRLPTLAAAGIDSLSSIRIASKLRSHGFAQANATDILEARSLIDLQKRLDQSDSLQKDEPTDVSLLHNDNIKSILESHDLLSAHMSGIQDIIACTPVQSAMLSETAKDPHAYCNWIELEVDIHQTMEDVEKAIHALVAHHEMLRAGFVALQDVGHPHASIIWRGNICPVVQHVNEFDYDYEIRDDLQLFKSRPVQLRQSDQGVKVLLQLHHSLYDQWSMDVLKNDFDTLLQGRNLPPQPSYTAVTAFHSRHGLHGTPESETEYWQTHLQSAAATPLPQLNGEKTSRGLQRSSWLPLDVSTASLKQKAVDLNASTPAIFQAAFAYLLSLYTGSSDVMYGSVFSGRHIPVAEVERIVGPCLATLPARSDIASARTCKDFIRAIHGQNRSMLKHSATPLAEVKKIGTYAPNEVIFDTLFVWQESTFERPLLVQEVDSADHHELNMVLEVEPGPERVAIRVTYQQDRILPEQVKMLCDQMQYVVQQFMQEPQTPLEQLLHSLPNHLSAIDNPHPLSHSHHNGLVAALEDLADQMPLAPALIFGQSLAEPAERFQSLSYSDMHAQANRLARHLISQNVEPDDLVCVCMDKSLDLYVAILAVLKTGAGYLPLLPDTPKDRVASILEQTSVKVFLCDTSVPNDIRSVGSVSIIDLQEVNLSQQSGEKLSISYNGSHAAYSIFTSGSTGTPKGLVVTQDNLLGNLAALVDIYPVKQGDRLLQACSQAFDVSVFEIFFAFFTGMPLCFARKDELFQDIEHSIRALQASHLSLTPTVAALVDPDNVPCVRFLVTAGEAMTDVVHRRWAGRGLHQGYGPSETTNICTVNPQMPTTDIISNIGPAFRNTSAFVIHADAPFQVLPFGAVGELAFGGEQVFRGYIGRDELNAEKIVKHHLYGRVYRSGDIGRMLPNGTILISGRLDDQVKVRGNRIELGEITTSLLSQSGVNDCTTLVLGKDAASQMITSFWIPDDITTTEFEVVKPTEKLRQRISSLYEHLESSLPPYMIPTAMIPMTTLPRTNQGKLDKRLLDSAVSMLDEEARAIYFRSSGHTEDNGGEWTAFERELGSALESTVKLPLANIGRNLSFFALGLNSINAIAFAKAIEKRSNQRVAVGTILRHSSLARLARALSEQPQHGHTRVSNLSQVFPEEIIEDAKSAFASISQGVIAVLPCTPLQESMLSASISHKHSAYSNKTTFKINGDLAKLKQVFRDLVRRHAILRTKFHPTSDSDYPFVQAVFDDIELPWTESIQSNDANGHHDNADSAVQITLEHPFQVVAHATGSSVLLSLHMHHAIYDGTSMSVLLEEAESMYHGQHVPDTPELEPFIAEVQNHAKADAMAFWSKHVDQFNAKPFPTRSDESGQSSQLRITAPLTSTSSDIDSFSRRHNISVASLFQAAWARVLAKAQGADDVCFGDVVSGRSVSVAGVERLVAPCFNTVPIRVALEDTETNIGLARSLHENKINADTYQLAPLRRIQAQSNTPDVHLFDSLMLVQPPARDLDSEIWEVREDEGLMDLPLVVEVVQSLHRPQLLIHYDTRYLSQTAASLFADAFAKSLEDCIQYPSGNAQDIPSLDNHLLNGTLATDLVPEDPSPALNDNTSSETWNETEQLIRQAFSHFSKVEESKIHKHTSLYRLGLDSLNAVQVASRLRSQGLTITAADILEYRTSAEIAEATTSSPAPELSQGNASIDLTLYDSDHRSKLLKPLGVPTSVLEALLPCTAAQNGMLAQSLQSQGSLYVNHVVYGIPNAVSENDIHDAWRQLQRKHQALRMGFVQTDEGNCPFAMMIYHENQIELPFQQQASSDSELGVTIVETLHRPTWRVTLDLASPQRTMTLSIHHALYDAESLQLLLCDLERVLRHDDVGTSPSIDAVLRPMLMGSDNAKTEAEQFWRKSLENASVTPFPNLNPVVTAQSDLHYLQKESSLSYSALEDLCKASGCTIQAAGQSAWAQLLSSYVGEGGVTFGTVFSGRTGSKYDSVVFPSLTTVPVFCNAAKASSEILADMTNFNGSAQRHRFAPLSDIQRYADLPGQALFDTVFVYQKSASGTAGSFSWPLIKQSAAVDYNVSMELETMPSGRVMLGLTANRGVVPDDHASLLLEQYDHVLARILGGDSASPIPSTDLYSATPAQYDSLPSPVQLLHQFVEEGAQRWPEQPALEFVWNLDSSLKSRQTWSYRILNERANQIAHLLQANGANPGDIVGVCMDKCPEASIAFIGILKAGCAFLALDPELPLARKQFILEDSGATVLLVDKNNGALGTELTTTAVELTAHAFDAYPTFSVKIGQIDPQATCYCLYTSGTTGTPKGCELTHENAVQAMMAFQKLFAGRWNSSSRWLQFASYWFDVSVLEQFWSWSVGITLVGAPRDLVLDDLTRFIQQLHITHIDLTPSLARILDPEDVPSLWDGVFITGGEALKQEIIEKWGSHRSICNGYGPTEATIGVTMNPFIGPDAKASNIGPAFLNVGSYVFVPGTTTPVLRGAVGELCVSGKLVGKGYLNRPELTAEAFPVLEESGEKIYRTGDLVRQAADGSFLFIGRQDSQAKLRGQRLEIDEIDAVIKQSSAGIADIASLVIKSPGGDKETLVTFFITAVRKQTREVNLEITEDSRSAARTALQACRDRLPGYMVPTHILPLNVIPLTVNNKIDAKRLTAFYNDLSVSALQSIKGNAASSQPLGESDQKLCGVLAHMLCIDRSQIDRSSNVFSLGLSSVSAISFANLLKRAGFSASSVALIMRNPTVGQLSDALSRGLSHAEDFDSVRQAQMSIAAFNHRYRHMAASRLAVKVEDVEFVAPCTPLQQGLILESLRSEEAPYFNKFSYVADSLDVPRLRTAFQQVADLVQPLRTKFIQTDDGHAQVILQRQEIRFYEKKTQQNMHAMVLECHSQWVARNQQEIVDPFEISIVESPSATLLTVYIHHALYDGISFDLLMDQVSLAYHGLTIDCGLKFTDALPYGPLRASKEAESFWTKHLGSVVKSKGLPTMNTDVPKTDPVETRAIDRDVNIDSLCKRLGVSHQAIAQACFAVALHQFAPANGTYGMVVSGRSIAFDHADRVLGPLFNTIPSPLHLQPGDNWTTLVQRCHEFNATALPYQHTPLRDIKKWCKFAPSDTVFDAIFVFQALQTAEPNQTSNLWKPLEGQTRADYPLAFELELDAQSKLSATVVAKRSIADGPMLQQMLQSFEGALRLINDDPLQHISQHFKISTMTTSMPEADSNGTQQVPYLNGVHDFTWTPQAIKLRSEIARMASLDEHEIDEHTTIFSLGLDSIDAVKLTSKLKRDQMFIPVSKLLRAQTIPRIISSIEQPLENNDVKTSDSALQILEQQLSEALSSFATVDKTQVERILPATPSQEALIAEMLSSDFNEYYNHDVLRLASDIDVERLQGAWGSVLNRSPILRTCFVEVSSPDIDAVYAQVVLQPHAMKLTHLSAQDASELDDIVENIRHEAKQSPSALPTRLTFVEISSERYMILSLAHAQYDGHSLALIHQDLQRAYEKGCIEERPAADGVMDASLAAVNDQALAFWRSNLSGARVSRFPISEDDKESTILHRVEITSTVGAADARKFCQTTGISLQSLAQTTWALVLAHYTRCFEAMFGAVLACRDSEEAEQVLFPMMNTVAMRATLHGTRREMLKHMQDINTDVLAYQRTPLRFIQSAAASVVRSDASDRSNGLFDTLFVYQHRPDTSDQPNKPLYESVGGSSSIEYPVAVEVEAVDGNLVFRAACKESVLDHNGTQELLQRLDQVFVTIISSPDEPTISFQGTQASICGLPSAKFNEDDLAGSEVIDESFSNDQTIDSSDESTVIKDALSQVSKTPPEELSATSTIESIGIDSISAIKVIALLRKQGVKLSVSELVRARTVSGMAKAVQDRASTSASETSSANDIVARYAAQHKLPEVLASHGFDETNVQEILPALPGQVYMLNMWQKTKGQLFYPTFTYKMESDVNESQIGDAWTTLVSRHAILRTVFCATKDSQVPIAQVVLREAPNSFNSQDTEQLDHFRQPMVHLRAIKSASTWTLKLTIHHALYDAVSLPLLMEDLQALVAGSSPVQPATSLVDFLALSTTASAQTSRKEFWTRYLTDVKPSSLPQPETDQAQPRVDIFRPALLPSTRTLESLARTESLTPHAILFAAHARAYAHLARSSQPSTAGDDVVLGIYLSGRSHTEHLPSLRAPTLNLVPLLIRSASTTPLLESAKRVQHDLQLIGSAENGNVGLWEIAAWTGARVDAFVNFLRLPESANDSTNGNMSAHGRIEAVEDERLAARSRVIEAGESDSSFQVPKELGSAAAESNQSQDAYLHSLDLEATITPSGSLDVGLFCPAGMLGLPEAESVLAGLRSELDAIGA
ncbi:hypothetical protein Q7P37_003475 [Cladosporium fusiforme]